VKILVTGGCGYIGSYLIRTLDHQHEVKCFDVVLGHDLLDSELPKDVDTVVHLAGIVGPKSVDRDVVKARQINVNGTERVVSLGKRVIYASVLGKYDNVNLVKEETPPSPSHEYFKQKLEAERVVIENGGVVLRFGSLFGVSPRMRDDLLVNNMVKDAVDKGRIELYEPNAVRPITNISDAVAAIVFSINGSHSGIFNVVSKNMRKAYIAAEVKACLPDIAVEDIPGSDYEARSYSVSCEKLSRLKFIFNPRLQETICDIAQYYRKGREVICSG
jgi:nucleoside-diphosphate-sugar epimerase